VHKLLWSRTHLLEQLLSKGRRSHLSTVYMYQHQPEHSYLRHKEAAEQLDQHNQNQLDKMHTRLQTSPCGCTHLVHKQLVRCYRQGSGFQLDK
jgi:hypothetical protein